MIKKFFLTILSVKFFIVLTIILAYFFIPFNKVSYESNFKTFANEPISLSSAFKTWDAQHYIFLSKNGYQKNNQSDRFYPLLPLAIKIINVPLGNSVLSGLIASFIFSLFGLFYYYLFCKEYFKNKRIAFGSLIILLSFPTAFYLSLIYSESVCFFLTAGFFYYLYKHKFVSAAIFAFFLPLSRSVGIVIIFPFIVFWLIHIKNVSKHTVREYVKHVFLNKNSYLVLSPLLGLLAYFIIMYVQTGNPFEGLYMLQNSVVGNWKLINAINPSYFFVNLFFPDNIQIHGFTNSVIDRMFFIGYCISLYFIYKKFDKTLFVYALFTGMVPVFGNFMSYTRYVLLVFPIFMLLAQILKQKKYKILFYPVVLFLFIFQIVFLVMHVLSYWVA